MKNVGLSTDPPSHRQRAGEGFKPAFGSLWPSDKSRAAWTSLVIPAGVFLLAQTFRKVPWVQNNVNLFPSIHSPEIFVLPNHVACALTCPPGRAGVTTGNYRWERHKQSGGAGLHYDDGCTVSKGETGYRLRAVHTRPWHLCWESPMHFLYVCVCMCVSTHVHAHLHKLGYTLSNLTFWLFNSKWEKLSNFEEGEWEWSKKKTFSRNSKKKDVHWTCAE